MTRPLVRTATVALATAAFAAPSALARPDVSPPVAKPTVPAQHKQGARPADTNRFATRPVLDRPSTSPNSRPSRPSSPPVTVSVAPADRGIDWATIGIGVGASLLAFGAIAGIAGRTRRSGRARVTA